jgi:outer membrane protein OmpA-like peptidoglycan-associated protein
MYYEDIYSSKFNNTSAWSKASRLSFCLPTENESSVSANIDERRIYTYDSKTGNGDIYYSDYFGGDFNQTTRLSNNEVNTDKWQPHFYMGASGNIAFFSSENEPGGFGGLDIYMIKRNKFGSWSKPENLGPEINSKYDEDSPFLTFDGRYLYFSSNGEKSIGGYDIFRAEYKDGKFTNVENLGTPINSTHDDLYFTITMDNKNALISSFRQDGFGSLDIYQLRFKEYKQEISVLKGRIYTKNHEELIPENIELELTCINCENDVPISILPRIKDGRFVVNLTKCKNYELKYINSSDKSVIATQTLSTNCEPIYEEIYRELGVGVEADGRIVESYMYALTGSVYDKETKEQLQDVSIEIQDNNGRKINSLVSNEKGYFLTPDTSSLKKDSSYFCKLILKKEGYITVSESVNFKTGSDYLINIGAFGLEKSKTGKDLAKVIKINPIYYDFDKSNIRKDAAIELDKIVEIMNLNPSMVIELGSHTDCRGNNDYNLSLSNRRAISATEYIRKRITNGKKRISGVGYGETKLQNDCACDDIDESGCTEEQHQLNRRTEFIIIKE